MSSETTTIRISILDAFTAPLRKMAAELEGIRGKFDGVRRSFALAADLNQASQAVGQFGSLIGMALKKPVDEFSSFEQAMAKVSALTNEVGTEGFAQMRALAQELGSTTSYSAQQAAEAMAQFGQQGRTVNEILRVTPQALSLARAGMIDIGEAAAIMGTAMSGMQIPAEQTKRVVDVLAMAANAANTDVRGLGEAFSYVGPIAHDANLSFELTAALLGKLADAGMDSNRAGTGLRGVLSRLLSPSKEATKALREFGLSAKQVADLQRAAATGRLDESLRMLGEVGAKLPDEKRLKLLSDIFGQETQSAASALISAKLDVTSGKGLDDLVRKLERADGAAARTAAIMDNTLAGELERTGGAISDLAIKIGERLRPSVMQLAGGIQSITDNVAKWTEKNPELANTLLRVAAVTAGGALAMKGLLLVGSTLISTFALMRGAVLGVQAAYVATRAVILATPAALATARAALIAFDASLNGTAALLFLRSAGLVVAAAAAGYALGTWINDMTGASDKLASMFEWLTGKDYSDREKGAPTEQEYADGTVIDSKTGKIVKLGTGPAESAPKVVREARAAGKTTLDDINAFAEQRGASRQAVADLSSRGQGPQAYDLRPNAPYLDVATAPQDDSATREQTVVLERALGRNEKATKELVEEVRRSRLGPFSGTRALGVVDPQGDR